MPREQETADHYATLGLDRRCSLAQIRSAYRLLAKRHHPDVNSASSDATARIQALNTAHEILRDPARRRAYDQELDNAGAASRPERATRIERDVSQDVRLRISEFFRGTSLTVAVRDPANRNGSESYRLAVPAETAPGSTFRIPRTAADGGFVRVRIRASPDFRFKIRGSDLRCDLRISSARALSGGVETIEGAAGKRLAVAIPPHVKRGETIRIRGEGMPKARGGRGDLLVRVTYRPEVTVSRGLHR